MKRSYGHCRRCTEIPSSELQPQAARPITRPVESTAETPDQRAARRVRIGTRLILYPLALGLIALLWHQQHGSSAKGNVADVVHWKGITSQGQPIQVSTSGVVLTYLDTTVIEPCSEGGDFTFRWFPGEGRFAQHGETVRAEHTYSGIDDLTRLPYVARMRLEAQVGARAVGAVYGEATLTTTDGAVRCSSGPVTFALSR